MFVAREKEVNGIGMRVLSDGTAYLTGRGLATLCGFSTNTPIVNMGRDWNSDNPSKLVLRVKQTLLEKGLPIRDKHPYIEILQGNKIHAFPDYLCIAVLDYYAFEQQQPEAINNYRILAGQALNDFIYKQVGYDPKNLVPENWRQFHDRVSLTYKSVPFGYFSVFIEIYV